MRFILIPVLFAISFDQVVQSYVVKGGNYTSHSNDIYEWIFQTGSHGKGFDGWKMMFPFKINGEYVPYMEPNLTIYRRIFNIGLEFIRKLFRGDVKTEKEQKDDDPKMKDNVMTPTRRALHEEKMTEIANFCKDHQMTTNYLYDEVQRIKAQRLVKDELRNMVTHLENPNKTIMKMKVLKYYNRLKATDPNNFKKKLEQFDTNNLAITITNNLY